ncbi:hypothetical protein ACFV6M_01345 [Streptomyces californicus]|uniref:hypothetical protein n=1 Tax=Streptomyces californicus TaxID=67351 RepID=UPI00067B6AE9|nr:hypothetical protein F610DRAFT_02226 [Streptomyces sp. LaPpAH-199]
MGFTTFAEHCVCVSLVQNRDDLQTTTGTRSASRRDGEAESVGGMSGVDGELGLASENVRGEIGVPGDVGDIECFRCMTVGSALVANVLGEPACQLLVPCFEREKCNGVGAMCGSAPRGEGGEMLLESG